MKKYLIVLILLIFSNLQSGSVPQDIPQGEWKYGLFVNGRDVGTAVISNKIKNNNYISSSQYDIKLPDMKTITRDTIIETTDFAPVRLESYNKIIKEGKVTETKIISVFKGRDVELTYGDRKYNYIVNRDFIIDGNYFMSKMIQAKFKKGFETTNYVYNPSIEVEAPIKVKTKVIGFENIIINGKENNLIHISQSIENIKDNVDLYIDEKGVLQKGIIRMLNLKIELIKK